MPPLVSFNSKKGTRIESLPKRGGCSVGKTKKIVKFAVTAAPIVWPIVKKLLDKRQRKQRAQQA